MNLPAKFPVPAVAVLTFPAAGRSTPGPRSLLPAVAVADSALESLEYQTGVVSTEAEAV